METGEACAICFGSMDEQCSIKTCGHQFCFNCISKWVETKTVCPLCNSKVEALVVTNSEGTREQLIAQQTNKLKESTLQDDLSCLDHRYFLDEVARLFQAAENAEQQMRIKMVNKNVTMGYRGVKTINFVFEQLNDYQDLFCSCEQFDPQSTLEGLYELQEQINLVKNGEFHKLDDWEEEVQVQRYGADDVPDFWSDEEDEDHDTYPPSKQKNKGKWEPSWSAQTPQKAKVTTSSYAASQAFKADPTLPKTSLTPLKTQVEDCKTPNHVLGCAPEKDNQNLHSPTVLQRSKMNGTKTKKKGKEFIFEPVFYENNKNKNNTNKKQFLKSKAENFQRKSK